MARKIDFVPSTSNAKSSMALESIPDEIKTEIEDMYKLQKESPDGRFRVVCDTKEELAVWARYAMAYAEQRPTELGGPIRVRKSPTRSLPENTGDFRVTDPLTEKDAATDAVKTATEAVKTAAKKATARK